MPKNNIGILPNTIGFKELKPHLRNSIKGSASFLTTIIGGGSGDIYRLVPEKVFYVSPKFSTEDIPYFDNISDAITEAPAGQDYLIVVYPGEYDETLTCKNGVNFYFHRGVYLKPTITTDTDIIDCSSGVTVSFDGQLIIEAESDKDSVNHIFVDGTSSLTGRMLDCLYTTDQPSIQVDNGGDLTLFARDLKVNFNAYGSCEINCNYMEYAYIYNSYTKINCYEIDKLDVDEGRVEIDFMISNQNNGNWEITGGEVILYNGKIENLTEANNIAQTAGIVYLNQIRIVNESGDCYFINGDSPILILNDVTLITTVAPASQRCIESGGSLNGNSVRIYQGYANNIVGTFVNEDYQSVLVSNQVIAI